MPEAVADMQSANDRIAKAKTYEMDLSDTLVKCQESAIRLGTEIEQKYTRDVAEVAETAVGILESYCENIYQMSEDISDETQRRKIAKKIQKQ